MDLSPTEENYLKAIYMLSPEGDKPVSTNAISNRLKTQPASVSDMLKKLSRKEVIRYQKYKGVSITEKGEKMALSIIRKHRLWEVFLVKTLHFQWDEVHEVAEQLEHVQAPLLIKRLEKFLGHPKYDPHGDPIPDENGEMNIRPQVELLSLKPGESGRLAMVKDSGVPFLRYLDKIDLHLGDRITMIEKMDYDGSVIVNIKGRKDINLSRQVAENLVLD